MRAAGKSLRIAVGRLRRAPATGDIGDQQFLATLDDFERDVLAQVRPYTMTSPQRQVATLDAVEYVVRRGVPGDFVECGVWRGGVVLAMILALQRLGVDDRDLWLFDTFEGMTEPEDVDTSPFDEPARSTWERARAAGRKAWHWYFDEELTGFGKEAVEAMLVATGYPPERLHLVQGPVEDTLPSEGLDRLALLRLDTDWYASTRHELECLYPLLSPGGVLLIDDYGHWDGCRRAVDEFFGGTEVGPVLLARSDYTGRLVVKC